MDVTANNKRVLIVDDEPVFLALLNVVLVKAGYEVKEACDGEKGYELAKSFMPALIVSDLVMPRLNGEGFLKKIRADKELKEIGFIILSGKGTHESTIYGLLGGADDYIPKPFQKEELLARVKTNIRVSNCLEEIKQKNRLLEEKNNELEDAYSRLKDTQTTLLQQEKMASIGQLAAGIAHEINNPIGFIMSNLYSLQKYSDKIVEFLDIQSKTIADLLGEFKGDANKSLASIEKNREKLKIDFIINDISNLVNESTDGTERIKNIVLNLINFSQVEAEEYKMVKINDGLDNTLSVVCYEVTNKIDLKKEYGDIPLTRCNPGQLNQAFLNILVNAIQSIEKHGEIFVKTWSNENHIFVSVSDTGVGIPEDIQRRVFEPFFTTRDVGSGTGLGLSVAFKIIKEHNGEIHVESETGKGTTFTVKIPIVK